jgi:uridine phosphorylase
MPLSALIDEGTSRHYRPGARTARPSASGATRLQRVLTSCGASCHRGPVWTTDGVFRETAGKVGRFREKGALAVEMELSALFTAGAHLGVSVAGLLVVSDLLWGAEWQPGFRDPRFQEGRRRAVQVIERLCRTI